MHGLTASLHQQSPDGCEPSSSLFTGHGEHKAGRCTLGLRTLRTAALRSDAGKEADFKQISCCAPPYHADAGRVRLERKIRSNHIYSDSMTKHIRGSSTLSKGFPHQRGPVASMTKPGITGKKPKARKPAR